MIKWRELKPLRLQAYRLQDPSWPSNPGYPGGSSNPTYLKEEDFYPIVEWCKQTGCGRRMSFDQFWFYNQQELLMFTLRWA